MAQARTEPAPQAARTGGRRPREAESRGRQTVANPYDQAIDTLRTAALRRDAALVATTRTNESVHVTADAAIIEEMRPEAKASR